MTARIHTQRCTRGRRGFTLIEIMIVVALIGIMAAIAYPQFDKFLPRYRVDGVVAALRSDLELARTTALRNQDESGRRYAVLVYRGDLSNLEDDYIAVVVVEATRNLGAGAAAFYQGLPGTLSANEGLIRKRVISQEFEGMAFGPTAGFPSAYADPYAGVPRSWCTHCGAGNYGAIIFNSAGEVTTAPSAVTNGSITVAHVDDVEADTTQVARALTYTIVGIGTNFKVWRP